MNWEKVNIFNFGDRKFLWFFLVAAMLIHTPLQIRNEGPPSDAAFRCAPLAETFVRGEFRYAFSHRCQMMPPLCTGSFDRHREEEVRDRQPIRRRTRRFSGRTTSRCGDIQIREVVK